MKKLVKLLFVFGFVFGFTNTVHAQENYGGALNGFIKFGENSSIGGFYEFQVANNITVSPEAIIAFGDDSWIGLGGRADYYFDSLINLPEPWDIWAGIDSSLLINGNDTFNINIHAGVEYKFSDMWGVIAEFGGGKTTQGGIGMSIHF